MLIWQNVLEFYFTVYFNYRISNDFLQTNVSIGNIQNIGFLDSNNDFFTDCFVDFDGQDLHIFLEQFGSCAQRIKVKSLFVIRTLA